MSTPTTKKYVRCKAFATPGRCRRKAAWRRAYCPAHQKAHDDAAKGESALREAAIELCCEIGEIRPFRESAPIIVQLKGEKLDAYLALYAANERLQSALVRCGSFGGIDPDVEALHAL